MRDYSVDFAQIDPVNNGNEKEREGSQGKGQRRRNGWGKIMKMAGVLGRGSGWGECAKGRRGKKHWNG